MQYGMAMGDYNFCNNIIPRQLGVNPNDVERKDFYNSMISMMVPLGATIGSLFGGKFAGLGR